MTQTAQREPVWPLRLRQLCRQLQTGAPSPNPQELRGEIWAMLNFALRQYLEPFAGGLQHLSSEDAEDLASEKSLDLLRNLESGAWDLGERTGPEIAAYLAATARNGAVDLLRTPDRHRRVAGTAGGAGLENANEIPTPWPAPDSPVEHRAFVDALRECADGLQPRSRRIWFFRAFYGLATKEIAAHPDVALQPAHVDVVLSNVRKTLRECMEGKGQRLRDLPAGTFFEIWKSFRGYKLEEVGINGQAFDTSSRA